MNTKLFQQQYEELCISWSLNARLIFTQQIISPVVDLKPARQSSIIVSKLMHFHESLCTWITDKDKEKYCEDTCIKCRLGSTLVRVSSEEQNTSDWRFLRYRRRRARQRPYREFDGRWQSHAEWDGRSRGRQAWCASTSDRVEWSWCRRRSTAAEEQCTRVSATPWRGCAVPPPQNQTFRRRPWPVWWCWGRPVHRPPVWKQNKIK